MIAKRRTMGNSSNSPILIDVLGYVGSSAGATWTVAKNQPIGSGNIDVALGMFDPSGKRDMQAPSELKGAKTKDLDAIMAGRHKSPVQQAWESGICVNMVADGIAGEHQRRHGFGKRAKLQHPVPRLGCPAQLISTWSEGTT